jgi:apolipoprotein D and lipocalin family protein
LNQIPRRTDRILREFYYFKSQIMKKQQLFCIILTLFTMSCSTQKNPLKTVPEVNLEKYAGKWYEIARLPNRFEKDCECVTATYGLTDKKYITVKNQCRQKEKGEWKSIRGKAFVVSGTGNARLKVMFFWPFKGDYRIIALDDDYQYAMVGSRNRKYLWILSGSADLGDRIYESLRNGVQSQRYHPYSPGMS